MLDLLQQAGKGADVSFSGAHRSAHALLAALMVRHFPGRRVVVVTDTLKTQEAFHADLTTWLNVAARTEFGEKAAGRHQVPHFFPAWEVLPHESKLPHFDVISERLETLGALLDGPAGDSVAISSPVVTSATALLQRTFPAGELRARTRRLERGQSLNPLDFIEWLEEQGYEPEARVTSKGELSWRGGIVDLWPLSEPWPIRLEFFGDELESLREFDPASQISRETVEAVRVPPAGEISLLKTVRRKWESDANAAPAVADPPRALNTLLDYLPPDSLLVLSDPEALLDQALRQGQQVTPGDPFHARWEDLLAEAGRRGMTVLGLTADDPSQGDSADGDTLAAPLDAFRPIGTTLPEAQVAEVQRRTFFHQMHRWLRQGLTVHVFCNNEGEQQRFSELWTEYGLEEARPGNEGDAVPLGNRGVSPATPVVHLGTISRGFLMPSVGAVVVTDAEIYGRYKISRSRRLKSPHAQAVRSAFEVDFSEFEEGDYVVHLQNGIGIFRGLKVLPPARTRGGVERPAEGGGQECLVIEYAARDSGDEPPRLYVPVSEAHLVSKYVGAGKARPQLSTLGGTRWIRAKEQAEHAVRDLAGDLLRVQAARSVQLGCALAPDTHWQREFEAAFEFEETPDQLKAIEAAKKDLESPRPMDRLLCGDVGFGKTEVAIRAAFKAVMSGKQVGILVPTTVLAQQHYNHFRERMAGYPVRIELLSRFRTPRQQKVALEAVAAGAADILIGTHRMVSADVQFKDLGLVVVDEEQKFGVRHKERLKHLRTTVDVLTLSATPIPRTLYLALTGARDLSTLETPPQDRLPVETVVGNYDERVIRDAIQREINRGGQVYFLHNRVATIEQVALKLRALIPEARMLIGHGQMDPDDLERVMTQFVNGEADVLVSTTIIESGLDIPNANTIIIDRADRFGLSELYQLRGRVGRYKHQAYCYLMLPRHAQLLTEARKRMSAIKQYSALGSGFKIALRDLEIRGAGNILGAQQSGHITAVGFDLYCQLLKQSVAALKGESVARRLEVRVSLDFLAMNPGEEGGKSPEPANRKGRVSPRIEIEVPREGVMTYFPEDSGSRKSSSEALLPPMPRAPAYLPADYLREPAERLEIYRKLAQASQPADLQALGRELRDRFGPPPPPVELLMGVHEIRLLAAMRNLSAVEVTDGKVKLTRNRELITVGGQFPRLGKREARARMNELRRLIESLG
ncbi:MAG: hypothetical protein RIS76_36 [Verrucomicrobiota bacterium]